MLDIGCNAGFYSFEMARRGADVLGIDVDARYLRQAEWAAEQLGLADRVELRRMQVYDLAHIDVVFDLVLSMGVLYHLRYPLLALDIVSRKVNRLLLFRTLTMPGEEVYPAPGDLETHERDAMRDPGWPKMAFVEHHLAGDPTNWWAPNHACAEAMLRSCGLCVVARPTHEAYLCEPNPESPSSVIAWNAAELLAATGQPWQDDVIPIQGWTSAPQNAEPSV